MTARLARAGGIVVAAASAAACQTLLVFDRATDESRVADDASTYAPAADGAARDASVTDSGRPVDAATALESGVVVVAVSGDGGAGNSCANGAVFCADFDTPDALAAWTSADPGVTLGTDPATSSTQVAIIESAGSNVCTIQQLLEQSFSGTFSAMRIIATVRTDSDQAAVSVHLAPDTAQERQILVASLPTDLLIRAQKPDGTGAGQETVAWTSGRQGFTTSSRLQIDFTSSTARVTWGTTTTPFPFSTGSALVDPRVIFGTVCPTATAHVWVDDVSIFLTP